MASHEIMVSPGIRYTRVKAFTHSQNEEHHERLQPQGGRRLGTCQSDYQRCRDAPRKGNPGIHQVSERRGRSRRAHALHESAPRSLAEAGGICGLHGRTQGSAQIALAYRVAPLRYRIMGRFAILIVVIAILFLSACSHPRQARVSVPPPPPRLPETTETAPPTAPSSSSVPPEHSAPLKPPADADLAEPVVPANAKPIETETGLASWYGPPYHNRRGSNGEVYNMHAMTAAHRTYPLGSIVRVTNLKTG